MFARCLIGVQAGMPKTFFT